MGLNRESIWPQKQNMATKAKHGHQMDPDWAQFCPPCRLSVLALCTDASSCTLPLIPMPLSVVSSGSSSALPQAPSETPLGCFGTAASSEGTSHRAPDTFALPVTSSAPSGSRPAARGVSTPFAGPVQLSPIQLQRINLAPATVLAASGACPPSSQQQNPSVARHPVFPGVFDPINWQPASSEHPSPVAIAIILRMVELAITEYPLLLRRQAAHIK